MKRIAAVALVAASLLALQAMRQTRPNYASITSQITVRGGMKQSLSAKEFKAEVLGYKVARKLTFKKGGVPVDVTTSGLWVLVVVKAEALTTTTLLSSADWEGSSGARYAASGRAPSQLPLLNGERLDPGLEKQAVLVFEIPEDQLANGRLHIAAPRWSPMSTEVVIDMPPYDPAKILDAFAI